MMRSSIKQMYRCSCSHSIEHIIQRNRSRLFHLSTISSIQTPGSFAPSSIYNRCTFRKLTQISTNSSATRNSAASGKSFKSLQNDLVKLANDGNVENLRCNINMILDKYPEETFDEKVISAILDAYKSVLQQMISDPVCHIYSGDKWELVNDIDNFIQDIAIQKGTNLTSKHFTLVLSMWEDLSHHTTNVKGIPERATSQLHLMERLALEGNLKIAPSIGNYNTVIRIWSNVPSALSPFRADAIIRRIGGNRQDFTTVIAKELNVKPNAETYRIMLKSWSELVTSGVVCNKRKYGGAAYTASGYLRCMIQSFENGEDSSFEPSLQDYLSVLSAWAKASESQMSGKRALSILNKMEYLNRVEKSDLRPDLSCYKYVLCAIANGKAQHSKDMSDEAERILSRMEQNGITPDSDCYSYAIKTCSLASQHNELSPKEIYVRATKANELLDRMTQMYYKSGTVLIRPTTTDYDNVMCAWSKCEVDGVAEKVEALLKKMEQLNLDGDVGLLPSRNSYLFAIKAWRNSPNTAKQMEGALNVLKLFQAQYNNHGNDNCKPNAECYNAFISVFASRNFQMATDDEKREAFKIVLDIMQEMKNLDHNAGRANSSTYNLLLDAFEIILKKGSKEYHKAMEYVFSMCRKEGMVDEKVLKTFHRVAPYESYRQLVLTAAYPRISSDGSLSSDTMLLPDEWSRNTLGFDKFKNSPLSLDGRLIYERSKSVNEHKNRRLRRRVNQSMLRGGRM